MIGDDELEKTGTQIQAVAREQERNEQTETAEHNNRFKNVDIGRNIVCSTTLGTTPDCSEVHLIAFVLHCSSPNIGRTPSVS
jgi:hypothetical protein